MADEDGWVGLSYNAPDAFNLGAEIFRMEWASASKQPRERSAGKGDCAGECS